MVKDGLFWAGGRMGIFPLDSPYLGDGARPKRNAIQGQSWVFKKPGGGGGELLADWCTYPLILESIEEKFGGEQGLLIDSLAFGKSEWENACCIP